MAPHGGNYERMCAFVLEKMDDFLHDLLGVRDPPASCRDSDGQTG